MKINYSIVIITHNRPLYFKKCLDSVVNAIRRTSHDKFSEIIVVNSGHDEKLVKMFIYFYKKINIKYYYNSKKNISRSRNIGVKYSINEYLVFIDDDVVVKQNFFEGLSKLWTDHFDKKIIGGDIFIKSGANGLDERYLKPNEREIIRSNSWCFAYQEKGSDKDLSFGDLLFSACFSYRLDQGEKNVFNENFGVNYNYFILGGEDFELCSRLILEKRKIFYSKSKNIQVFHFVDNNRFRKFYLMKKYFFNGVELAKIEKYLKKIINLKNINHKRDKIYRFSAFFSIRNFVCKYELYRLTGYILYNIYFSLFKKYEFKFLY